MRRTRVSSGRSATFEDAASFFEKIPFSEKIVSWMERIVVY